MPLYYGSERLVFEPHWDRHMDIRPHYVIFDITSTPSYPWTIASYCPSSSWPHIDWRFSGSCSSRSILGYRAMSYHLKMPEGILYGFNLVGWAQTLSPVCSIPGWPWMKTTLFFHVSYVAWFHLEAIAVLNPFYDFKVCSH